MDNQLAELQTKNTGLVEIASTRQAQEVQAAIIVAQKFPRDEMKAYQKVMEACKRKTLAEKAVYAYPRGNQKVTGPSIRLAETIAKAWGNLDFGIVELEKKPAVNGGFGESVMQSYCWDLETNTRSTKVFTVIHKRDTNKGSYKLTDERDIYEIAANNGARRLRACILSVLPSDVVEDALEACRTTIKSNVTNLTDTVRKMVRLFKEVGVTQEMIEQKLGYGIDLITQEDIVDFQSIYNSIKDGAADRTDFFKLGADEKREISKADHSEQQPAVEAKSIKSAVKNYAPQTSEEAQNRKPGQSTASPVEPTPTQVEAEEIDFSQQQKSRPQLIAELNDLKKLLKYTNDVAFFTDCRGILQAPNNKFTDDQLQTLIDHFKAVANAS